MAGSMDIDWRENRDTIRVRNKYLYNNELLSDVAFSVVNIEDATVTFPAHKYVLAISSPVFQAMFYGNLAETSGTIKLPDCTAEGLLEILRYVYYDELVLSVDTILEIIYIAKKYQISPIIRKCISFLENEMKPGDVVSVLEEIARFEDEDLTDVCWEVVERETQTAVTSEAFLNVTQETLCDMLERDDLDYHGVGAFPGDPSLGGEQNHREGVGRRRRLRERSPWG